MCLGKILRQRSSHHQPRSAWFSSQRILCDPAPQSVLSHIGHSLDRNRQIDIHYLDFPKVRLGGSLNSAHKTSWSRPDESVFSVGLKAYINGMTQRVVVDGEIPCWSPVTSRVPQGSIIGFVLLIMFIN